MEIISAVFLRYVMTTKSLISLHLEFCFNPQLFDFDNPINQKFSQYLFSTEGHIFPLNKKLHRKPWTEDEKFDDQSDTVETVHKKSEESAQDIPSKQSISYSRKNSTNVSQQRRNAFLLLIMDFLRYTIKNSLIYKTDIMDKTLIKIEKSWAQLLTGT